MLPIFRHVTTSVDFFQQCQSAEDWMKGKEELLNTRFALSEFKLEEGENLLKEMQELRDELSNYEDEVQRLIEAAGEIVPLRARRERLRQPIDAVAICAYQSHDVSNLYIIHNAWALSAFSGYILLSLYIKYAIKCGHG